MNCEIYDFFRPRFPGISSSVTVRPMPRTASNVGARSALAGFHMHPVELDGTWRGDSSLTLYGAPPHIEIDLRQ